MSSTEPASDLTAGIALLGARLRELRGAGVPGRDDALMADLESAHEELRVADEEVRAQRLELEDLVAAHHASRAVHERLIALLPTPIVVTDGVGTIRAVNAAAAGLLQLRVDRLMGKPIFAFVDQEERRQLRYRLSQAVAERAGFRCTAALRIRDRSVLRAEVAATVTPGRPRDEVEVNWVLTSGGPERGVPDTDPRLALSLAELATLTVRTTDRGTALANVAHVCQRAFPIETFVSITLGAPAEPELLATDSRVAQRLDGLQVAAGEGPCQEAWETGELVECRRMDHDDRWPRLQRLMTDDPPVAALALPIRGEEGRIGALNIYAHDPALASDRWIRHGELLAATVTAVLHEVEAKAELEAVAGQLRTAMDSRAPIEQAKGVLMATRGCSADEAFELLRRMSNRSNVRIRDLAEQILARAGGEQLP